MKVLLAVDGSDYTKRMLAYLAAHDELLGKRCDYVAVTVVASVPALAVQFLDSGAVSGYYTEEADKVLKPVEEFARMQGWALRAVRAHGHAAQTIAEMARDEKADLVVMGSNGLSTLGNIVMGSVATGVMARCTIPVLLVR